MSETLWDRVRRALKREKRDFDDAVADATRHGNEVLAAKEHELTASPEERLTLQQQRADAANDEFEQLKQQIERKTE